MKKFTIAVVSFPGNNCEVESLRAIAQSDMEPVYFRWNDDREKLNNIDGYFLPGGFSYEDRGRSGMVAGRDPLMEFIGQEAEEGKVVIGNCNGAQILVESGLIPLDHGLRMSLARNVIEEEGTYRSPGFLSEWVWVKATCAKERCATSNWNGTMHMPIAHGEGRFTTKDRDVIEELRRNDQLAFSYCDERGNVSLDPIVTPNGSMFSAAGICNPAGNVVALMPHPERTPNGKPYFDSLRQWIERNGRSKKATHAKTEMSSQEILLKMKPKATEIFIDTIIVNNEERTVEQTARKYLPSLRLKQWKYLRTNNEPVGILSDLSTFNANKERAYIRRGESVARWDAARKREEPLNGEQTESIFGGIALLRHDIPDTGGSSLGKDGMTGVCYLCRGVNDREISSKNLLEVFANASASELVILQ
jgi:phosphoribosylformylglycinamidine synthase I